MNHIVWPLVFVSIHEIQYVVFSVLDGAGSVDTDVFVEIEILYACIQYTYFLLAPGNGDAFNYAQGMSRHICERANELMKGECFTGMSVERCKCMRRKTTKK